MRVNTYEFVSCIRSHLCSCSIYIKGRKFAGSISITILILERSCIPCTGNVCSKCSICQHCDRILICYVYKCWGRSNVLNALCYCKTCLIVPVTLIGVVFIHGKGTSCSCEESIYIPAVCDVHTDFCSGFFSFCFKSFPGSYIFL